MHDMSGNVEPAVAPPLHSPFGLPAPPSWRRGAARLLLAPFLFLRRRPGRTLGVLALLALIIVAINFVGLFLWVDHHLRGARRAVEQGHNGVAIRHLRAC